MKVDFRRRQRHLRLIWVLSIRVVQAKGHLTRKNIYRCVKRSLLRPPTSRCSNMRLPMMLAPVPCSRRG